MGTGKNKYSLKNLRNRYQLTITNEDTYEELAGFNLSRWTVYVILSLFFILLVGMTVLLIAFTSLKFYIPGYGTAGAATEYEILKNKTDSLENVIRLQEQYYEGIRNVLKGNPPLIDTTLDPLEIDEMFISPDEKDEK